MLESAFKSMNSDMVQLRNAVQQIGSTVLAQKQAIDQLEAALRAATAKGGKAKSGVRKKR